MYLELPPGAKLNQAERANEPVAILLPVTDADRNESFLRVTRILRLYTAGVLVNVALKRPSLASDEVMFAQNIASEEPVEIVCAPPEFIKYCRASQYTK